MSGRQDVAERARQILREGPPLRLAVLFGSWALRRERSDSDVDVGIIPVDPAMPFSQELDLQLRLTLGLGREVDLVRLDQASTLLKWEVARDGVVIVAATPVEAARFRAEAAIEHADLAESLAPVAALYRRRLADAASGPARG